MAVFPTITRAPGPSGELKVALRGGKPSPKGEKMPLLPAKMEAILFVAFTTTMTAETTSAM